MCKHASSSYYAKSQLTFQKVLSVMWCNDENIDYDIDVIAMLKLFNSIKSKQSHNF